MADMEADNMAREMTPQERAAALLNRIVGIIPMQPSQREVRIEWLIEYAQETRRAALLEVAQVVSRAMLDTEGQILDGDTILFVHDKLDRLAQEGA